MQGSSEAVGAVLRFFGGIPVASHLMGRSEPEFSSSAYRSNAGQRCSACSIRWPVVSGAGRVWLPVMPSPCGSSACRPASAGLVGYADSQGGVNEFCFSMKTISSERLHCPDRCRWCVPLGRHGLADGQAEVLRRKSGKRSHVSRASAPSLSRFFPTPAPAATRTPPGRHSARS